MEPLSIKFLICCSIFRNNLASGGKPSIFSRQDEVYSWVVALLQACNVTKHDCHLGLHLGFYQKLEIKQERRENEFFLVLDM